MIVQGAYNSWRAHIERVVEVREGAVKSKEGAVKTNVDLLKKSPLACFGHVFPEMPLKHARSTLGFTAKIPVNCLPHLDNLWKIFLELTLGSYVVCRTLDMCIGN